MCGKNETAAGFNRDILLNDQWKFRRCEPLEAALEEFKKADYDDASWETVSLPHTPRIEPLVVNDQWQGICWYRRRLELKESHQDKKIFIEFEGAMQTAGVWVNGRLKTVHDGGYLPFTIDITDDVSFGKSNLIAVRLDNRDNPEVPPGKPLKDLDFCMYGGLYRNVRMHVTDRLHITDAVHANRTAGGGVFIQIPAADSGRAQIRVQTHFMNEYRDEMSCSVVTRLLDRENRLVAEQAGGEVQLDGMEDKTVVQVLDVRRPKLWSPRSPYLYRVESSLSRGGRDLDKISTRIGIRRIGFDAANGFTINGEKCYLRGTNRHQEYPYIGYALSDNAHFRDALKIKRAGFDFVRLSHYPHAPAFMDACDSLGLLVMDAIPGWQFFGNGRFQERSIQDCRDMIRRDRNHPSVILWEVSLNESDMTKAFMEKTHRVAHEEYPGDQCFTCGWQDSAYDLFIPARQHAAAPEYWKKYSGKKPLFISEYGDWEYYAQNAGFNQPEYRNLTSEERNSRQLRGFGERRLWQQALNFQEAFNDNLATPAVGCANWLIFDYNRGYADDIEASGICDIFRMPKFAYYFYASQRAPVRLPRHPVPSGPMCHVVSYRTDDSELHLKVYSNCEQVKLICDGRCVAVLNPDRDTFSSMLDHPPFTFKLGAPGEGTIEAVGLIGGREAARHEIREPAQPHTIRLAADWDGVNPAIGKKDVFFVHASVLDNMGTVVRSASDPVEFGIRGPGRLIGQNPARAEAGTASILVETTGEKGIVEITGKKSDASASARIRVRIAAGGTD
jgi:beta-galactosidase